MSRRPEAVTRGSIGRIMAPGDVGGSIRTNDGWVALADLPDVQLLDELRLQVRRTAQILERRRPPGEFGLDRTLYLIDQNLGMEMDIVGDVDRPDSLAPYDGPGWWAKL